MNTFKVFVATSTFALLGSAGSAANADTASTSACKPVQQAMHTDFPQQSQQNGEYGVVRLAIQIGADGRAAAVRVDRSSGYRALDQAAEKSVRANWRFDVSHCTARDLAEARTVNVQFQRAPLRTVSHSINTRTAALAKKLAANNRCDVTRDQAGNAVFACVPTGIDDNSTKVAQQAAAQ